MSFFDLLWKSSLRDSKTHSGRRLMIVKSWKKILSHFSLSPWRKKKNACENDLFQLEEGGISTAEGSWHRDTAYKTSKAWVRARSAMTTLERAPPPWAPVSTSTVQCHGGQVTLLHEVGEVCQEALKSRHALKWKKRLKQRLCSKSPGFLIDTIVSCPLDSI